MANRKTKAEKIAASRVERAYYARCDRVQVSIMDIPKIFKVGEASVAAGDDDTVLGDKMAAFVQTIRKN